MKTNTCKYILSLDAEQSKLLTTGGKGANLSELIRSSFKVPQGFVVTTAAYNDFVSINTIQEQIQAFHQISLADSKASLENISEKIRDLIYAVPVPEEIVQEITHHYKSMVEKIAKLQSSDKPDLSTITTTNLQADMPVAVRSSATAEDLPELSFAGLQDSYLNIKGETALIDAVKRCWASLWTSRAIAYRNTFGIDSSCISMGVVVQELIAPEKSGILFTANPITGNPDECLINANWGLGESVVSGKSTPDHITFDKKNKEVIIQEIADKRFMVVAMENSIKEVPVPSERQTRPVLSKDEMISLVQTGNDVETLFKNPQDIEWAICKNEIYLLQSRPITQMPSQKTAEIPGTDDWPVLGIWEVKPFDVWTRVNVGEVWRDPVSPLVASTIPKIISDAVDHSFQGVNSKILKNIQWTKRHYGRIYFNEGALRHVIIKELGLPSSILDKSRGKVKGSFKTKGEGIKPLHILWHVPVLWKLIARQWRMEKNLNAFITTLDTWIGAFMKRKDFDQSDKVLWEETLIWVDRIKHALNLQSDMSGFAMSAFASLEKLCIKWLGDKSLSLELITGLPGIHSAEIGKRLWRMSQEVKSLGLTRLFLENDAVGTLHTLRQSEEAKPLMDMFDDFLTEHGQRCPNEAEWLNPRWIDVPEQVIVLIKGYFTIMTNFDENDQEMQQRRETLIHNMYARLNVFQRPIMRFVLRRAQRGVIMRDNGKSHAMKATYPARKLSTVIGERWVKKGWLKNVDDIFFLTIVDIRDVIANEKQVASDFNFHSTIEERRKAYEYWFTVRAPDSIGPDGRPVVAPYAAEEHSANTLHGIPVSAGFVQGRVRVILDPYEAIKMQADEILVTHSTDTGWSVVFPMIAGLITEIGGQLSHAAILARECKLPTIVNVADATTKLKDGMLVSLDCSTGLIHINSVGDSETTLYVKNNYT